MCENTGSERRLRSADVLGANWRIFFNKINIADCTTFAFYSLKSVSKPKRRRPSTGCCRFYFIVLLVTGAVCVRTAPSTAATSVFRYEIHGNIREEVFYPKPQLRDFSFVCDVVDDAWSIQLDTIVPSEPRTIKVGNTTTTLRFPDSQALCSDGTNFYVILKTRSAGSIPPGLNARIGPGAAPFGVINDPMIVIWYSFASFHYFSDRLAGELLPLHGVSYSEVVENKYMASGLWELLTDPPHLPRLIQTTNDLSWASREVQKVSYAYTNVSFNVLAVTNVLGLTLPAQVAVDYFLTGSRNGKSEVLRSKHIELRTTNILLPSGNFEIPPPLIGTVAVMDMRPWVSNNPAQVLVRSTNEWPRDVEFKTAYAKMLAYPVKRSSPQIPTSSPKPAIAIRAILLCSILSCVPIFLFLTKRR